MSSKLAERWQEIDELLTFLVEKDRAWLARERTAASGRAAGAQQCGTQWARGVRSTRGPVA